MTTNDAWCRAMARLSLVCALLAGCGGDDGSSAGDTTGSGSGATETGASTGSMVTTPEPDGSTSATPTSTTGDGDETASSTGAATDDGGSESGSGSDGTSTGEAGLEIVGEWIEVFPGGAGMQTHTITEETWTMSSDFGDSLHHVESWDAEAGVLVAQSDESNAFNPELWGRFEWQWVDDALYYCQSVYDAATADDAWSAPGAEPGDLDTGCGGFSWSPLDPA